MTWQQLHDLPKFKPSVTVAFNVRWDGLSISETLQRMDQQKKRKYPVSGTSLGECALLMPEVRGEWLDCFRLIGRQVPLPPAKNRRLRLRFAQVQQSWAIEGWRNVAWSDQSQFCCVIPTVWSEFGTNNLKARIHPGSYQWLLSWRTHWDPQ